MTVSRPLGAVLQVLVVVSACALPAWAQEMPGKRVAGTGTYEGQLAGDRSYRTYAGDRVIERIQCAIKMTFHPGGDVSWETGDYYYEKTYIKYDDRGQEILKAITRIRSAPSRSNFDRPTRSPLNLTVSSGNPPLVQRASWTPVYLPATVELETRLRGRPPTIQTTSTTVYCEPYIRWRGADGKGPGQPLAGSYEGPDGLIAKGWVRKQGEEGPPRELQREAGAPAPRGALMAANRFEFSETTKVRVVWRLSL